ncbi:hypothetical protein JNB62_14560 [Microbacterium jejuense]|uniref:Uncharacterized protein n=1 Tax=Microbacterium jejuense TaxID=1263637 RepID=A0ABS7HPL9_9MICO|nr:hypothetical protein [Microbacterium jejuense]MBW9094912.1 hypothetical protein [Microbacterium jejuense]
MPPPGSSASVQSVLAVAGAGLVAVAALVFTFFNPDLEDPWARTAIIGAIAAAFLAGAPLLARRRLRFSAEAVGALGVAFVALTVTAALPFALNGWVSAALAALAAGGALALLGPRAGIRVWLWCGVVALAFVPVLLGLGGGWMPAATAGCLASAAASGALVARVPRTPERITLTVLQFGFVVTAIATIPFLSAATAAPTAILACTTFVAIAAVAVASAQHTAGAAWSGIAGAAIVAAATSSTLEALSSPAAATWIAALPTAAGLGLVLVGTLTPLHRMVSRGALFIGAVAVVAAVAVAPTLIALLALTATVAGRGRVRLLPDGEWAITAGLADLALTLALFAAITREDAADRLVSPRASGDGADAVAASPVAGVQPGEPGVGDGPGGAGMPQPLGTRWLGFLGAWYAALAFLTVLTLPEVEPWARIAIGLTAAVCASAVVVTLLRDASAAVRMPLVAGAHAAVLLAAVLSWGDPTLTVWAGAAVVATIGMLAVTVPRKGRFVHVGAGFAYALVVLATALGRAGADTIVTVCLTTCAAGAVAIAATFARRVPVREWYAVLVVTAVPFAIGVVQVVFERSGWTALSTAVIFCLALALTVTTRPALAPVVRTIAAAALVPSIAVVAVCLGAQALPMSGSPVVLPVIAAIVGATLASGDRIGLALARRLPRTAWHPAGLAIEASALLTAAIAVGLSLVRTSAGLPTTLLVLVILGVGFAATAVASPRRYAWPLAGAAFTGALWSAWGIAGVTGLEPYLLPPALGAATVAVVLTARGRRATGLYAVALGAAVVPVLFAAGLGRGDAVPSWLADDSGSPARAYALVASAWLLVAASLALSRATAPWARRLRVLRTPTLAVAIVASAAAAVQGVQWGTGATAAPTDPAIVGALTFGLIGAGAAASAARLLHRHATAGSALARTRWLGAPAVLIAGIAAWPAIERDWLVIWTMWGLAIGFLTLMVAVAVRGLRGATGLPPVWFLFAVSFVTAVVAWSPRDLRVEWFSLPLGAFLLAAGAAAMRGDAVPRTTPSLMAWPTGWTGSWALLAPGLVVMLSASVAATYTDPRTWRAILVMAIALVAILVGATRRLAAPFVIGIVVLPVENVLAFVVQIGRGIEAMPWWITLSVVGAVLLIIAVAYERRADGGSGLTARLRDLS